MLRKIAYFSISYLVISAFLMLLSGCGQTGALYLPDKTSIEKNKA